MKIGCWEVPKPTDPSLLWPAEWKAPAPLWQKKSKRAIVLPMDTGMDVSKVWPAKQYIIQIFFLDFLSVAVQVALGKRDYIPPPLRKKRKKRIWECFILQNICFSLRFSVNFRESYLVWLCPEGDYHRLGIVLANQLISSFEQVCFRSALPRPFCPK